MLPSFTVIDVARTRLFKVEFPQMNATLKVADSAVEAWFELNFDNFRRYTSPKEKRIEGTDQWKWDYKMLFVYETIYWELLAAKRLTVTFYVSEGNEAQFVGTAHVDVLTIAAGPCAIDLAVEEGDVEKGRLDMICYMEEVAEVLAKVTSVTVRGMKPEVNGNNTRISVTTKSDPPYTHTSSPPEPDSTGGFIYRGFANHFFGTTVEHFLQSAGFTFNLESSGTISTDVIGTCMVTFSDHLSVLDDGATSNILTFDCPVRDPNGDADSVVARLSGVIEFENTPLFIQMQSGKTVDGVVMGGAAFPGAKRVLPPRMVSQN